MENTWQPRCNGAGANEMFPSVFSTSQADGRPNGHDGSDCKPPRSSAAYAIARVAGRMAHLARGALTAGCIGLAVLMLSIGGALAANPYAIGDKVTNPLTGVEETVQELAGDNMVVTDLGNAIYVGPTGIGDQIEDPENPGSLVTITAVHTNETTNLVDSVTVADKASPPNVDEIPLVYSPDLTVPDDGTPGDEGGSVDVPVPTGNTNVFVDKRIGARGADGHDGGGIRICIIWCFTIGVNASAGSPGGAGPTLNDTVNGADITTISPAMPGVWVSSLGGGGGTGGDAYGINIPAGQGGKAGVGGNVTVTSNVDITTGGDQAYGIFAQSRAGAGGSGGSGYILSSGAGGGPAAQGGSVQATNNGVITTFGAGASGMMVQSLGGGGGAGGDSYGIVGVAGSASQGGHGGNASAVNSGTITTSGVAAHGVVAQSIGGSGGDGGSSGGIGAVGGTGNTGGNGGVVSVTNSAGAHITTNNSHSVGILAQSVGGGGGNGGTAGGIAGVGGAGEGGGAGSEVHVTNAGHITTTTTTGSDAHAIVAQSIGGGGGTGGVGAGLVGIGGKSTKSTPNDGGRVTVDNLVGSEISTAGTASHGILAQSIGGGGGTGAASGGLVAVGGDGSAAGAGGTVTVASGGSILTRGVDSKGILAQSIGGGGGSANASGGLVSLGGKGGSGGNGGQVTVTNSGQISTLERGGDAVVAQSIGGGGGDGGSSGGLVSLGGSGTSGGAGGKVDVTNSGSIATAGARARGVLAQSIGGGGGNGGDSGGLVSLGGSGSVASNGGNVTVTNTGVVSTVGNAASAIEAESIGGGGGSGGTSGGALFTLGGTGGGGGNAGIVTLNNSRNLSTQGDDSHGLFGQSIGGGGGNGGNSASVSAFVGVAVGGSGGKGGAGSEVTINASDQTVVVAGNPVAVTPVIRTEGDRAKGIFAQSVGGGGGSGGFAAQATVGYIASASVAVGGTGGDGGNGGTVRVNGDTTILTDGVDSDGMLVQSVGGGGGNGGFAVSFSGAAGDAAGVALGVGVGGKGGKGGQGGDVTLNAGGDILTEGAQSEGLIAQSVGGGGGTGGFSVTIAAAGSGGAAGAVSVGVGGSGGDGGGAGTVSATYAGDVVTMGDDSNAMLIQGVGGGGGNGGFSVSGAVSGAPSGSGAVAVGVGGSGGGGGEGGIVTANVTGDIGTAGDRSSGLVAQSIGGRGGNGAFNVSGTITGSGGMSGAVSVGVGGAGGGAGDARSVDATFTGNAATLGEDSDAVLVQSVGGGGGNGAFNVSGGISASAQGSAGVSVGVGGAGGDGGAGGTVTARATGDLETAGLKSNAFIAQSLGGGGGNGGFNVSGTIAASGGPTGAISVGVGGSGGGGGAASTVSATVTGDATTHGADATAIIAQSVGGGGGTGGLNVSGSISAAKGPSGTVAVGVGGSGGGGGAGGQTTLSVTGDVTTEGDGANGVMAQSLGGGGGAGGINVSGGVSLSTESGGALAVGVGGAGGDGGAGAAVNATLVGDITTSGDNAAAFTAQSVGGGGGAGGLNVSGAVSLTKSTGGSISVGVGGFGGGGGTASTVIGTVSGTVSTAGEKSTGVLAQSVGGGGGSGGLNVSGAVGLSTETGVAAAIGIGGFGGGGGAGGAVTLNRTGTTTTSGAKSDAVVAQSLGGGGGNGGLNISGGISASSGKNAFTATIGLGGFGGSGGTAADVLATVNGDVLATGLGSDHYVLEDGIWQRERKDGSNGVLAQSVGGSGGNGALNVSGGIAFAPPKSGESNALNIGVGGFGGSGGNAGAVTLNVTADTVRAIGDDRFAVGAQSIGGGGGNGGINVSGGIVLDGQITAGIGGFGGGGGTASTVNVTSDTDIFAAGDGAIGLMAQSVGGGGGNGGINVSGGIQPWNTSKSASLVFGLGGFGGAGNSSATVTAVQSGAISVEGANSTGVLAQSVAGGGGNGGLNVSGSIGGGTGYAAAIGVGGSGGIGSVAGAVTLTSDGAISVDGREPLNPDTATTPEQREALNFRERANGILVQSVGGGGGNGGMNVTGVLALSGSPLAAGVGGTGSGGGNAGAVSVTRGLNSPSLLQTVGRDANALTAQSIGGGGGNAGMNFVVEGSLGNKTGSQQAIFAIGGGGGAPGHGSTVDVKHVGDISTDGHQSDGILAQSVGGGGGNATFNIGFGLNKDAKGLNLAVGGAPGEGGSSNTVTVDHTGNITTRQSDSTAIFAQSVGGGGGNAGLDVAMSILGQGSLDIGVGRKGGTGGTGGNVVVTSDGTLVTLGDRSVGVLAQSVGNGGGKSGSYSFGASAKSTSGEGESQTSQSGKVSVKVGIEGGAGGTAGSVDVTTSGAIGTAGSAAHAIQAQSVGGGGGIGGAAMNFVLMNTAALNVGVGGAGGTGGTSGVVDVDNSAIIETLGAGAHGIYAQSIGGGGGVGGYAGVAELNFFGASVKEGSHTLAVSVGGTGGVGATGNTVTVDNTGSILTHGEKSYGISAQSIGGGGGDGGLVFDASIVGGKETSSLRVDVGGSGGTGGIGKDVTVVNEGSIHTLGKDSIGIRAESLGGGGGDAGLVGTLRIATSGGEETAGSLIVNIGGVGGTGGASGNVNVTNRHGTGGTGGDILTEGESAHGIFAQSLGGGGGNGSSILSANLAGGKGSALVGVNIGGAGGTGGVAGTVNVTNEAQIETKGNKAHGVFAQSVGGGGGNGGLVIAGEAVFAKGGNEATPLVSLGGSGGSGDDAGAVIVDNKGSIVTRGDGAHGIYAQSIGGGGGNAGIGVGITSGISSNIIGGAVSALFGGRGGEGGLGGPVTVHHSGDITVLGDNAQAVVAESINGGGGHVALDFQGITTLPGGEALPGAPSGTDTKPVFVFNGGGTDTQDSDASRVTLDYTGTFGAAGRNGAANSAQSIGGGGGTYNLNLGLVAGAGGGQVVTLQGTLGGVNGSNNDGGEIDGSHVGNLVTTGSNTPGLFVQSIGGGGGRASVDVSAEAGTLGAAAFSLGGENGTSESGGSVVHTQSGSIATGGAASDGAMLQSIGGGGGSLTYLLQQEPGSPAAKSAVVPVHVKSGRTALAAQSTATGTPVNVTLGSAGGSNLDGGAISLAMSGDVSTAGDSAQGLILQSIGGGGGKVSVLGTGGLTATVGGSGGASGDAAGIDVSHTGDISTTGARAHGIVLQSIGGGGGAVFTDAAAPSVTASSDNSGDGGAIHFAQVGDIVTTGTETYGLLAQSLGGGGGLVDGAFKGSAGGAGAGGAIELVVDGNLVTMGGRSTALFAQSAGSDGAGDLNAVLTAGHNIVGGANGVAVAFDGGADNAFDNHGSVMTMSGATGLAFMGGAGDDMIVNHGVVLGSVDLGEGLNGFANHAGAAFYSGGTVNLGMADNLLVQDGLLAPGAADLAVATQLSGSFRQSAGATSDFELDFGSGVIDSVIATGTVELDGTLDVSLMNTALVRPGTYEKVVYYGAGGLKDNGMAMFAQPSIVIAYELVFPDARTAALGYDVDFAPAGLVGNRIAIGDYVNRVQAAGSTAAIGDTITALVAQTELDPYSNLLTQLGPEFYAEQQAYTLGSVQRFARVMHDCGSIGAGPVPGQEQACVWARFDYDTSSRDSEEGFPSTEETALRYSTGYQRTVDSGWTYGIGADFEDNDSNGFEESWQGQTTTVQLGLLARRAFGPASVGAIVTLGNSDQDVRRGLSVTEDALASGRRDVTFASGVLDVTYEVDLKGLSMTPALNLGVSRLHGESMTESGAGAQNLVLEGRSETHAWVEPAIGFNFDSNLANSKLLRVYARLGALYYLSGDTTEVLAGLEGAPSGVDLMLISSDLDSTHFLAEGGFELIATDRYTLSVSYGMQRSDIRSSDAGTARITIPVH